MFKCQYVNISKRPKWQNVNMSVGKYVSMSICLIQYVKRLICQYVTMSKAEYVNMSFSQYGQRLKFNPVIGR